MSPSEIIANKLAANQDLNLVLVKNLFWGREPESPDFCTTVYDTGGDYQSAKFADDRPTIQVRVRSRSYSEGFNHIEKISLFLNGIEPFNFGDERVEGIWLNTPITPIGRDKTDHSIFTLNLRLLITPSNPGNRQQY